MLPVKTIELNGYDLNSDDLASCDAPRTCSITPEARRRCRESRGLLLDLIQQRRVLYGITTGFGDSVDTAVDTADTERLQENLYRYHGIGTGPVFSAAETRAILLVRLNALSRGASAVREELLDRIALLLNADCLPRIPEQGSVGASGDLTPLSYLAAVIAGERDVVYRGTQMPSEQALAALGVPALKLSAKEGLALMNGTSVMTALAGRAVAVLDSCLLLATELSAAAAELVGGDQSAFSAHVHAMKPHAGQAVAAAHIHEFLASGQAYSQEGRLLPEQERFEGEPVTLPYRLQAPYSIRCAPHVLGPARDMLQVCRQWIHTELNSSNDNPLFDTERQEVYFAGHFYGGQIVLAADSLRNAVATVAELVDKQCLLLLDARRSGLPSNLVSPELRASGNHGLKALGITVSSLAAEIAHLSAPVAPHTRPTESMNQDIVSMGTISARRLRESCDMLVRLLAMQCIVVAAGYDCRTGGKQAGDRFTRLYTAIRQYSGPLSQDRALDLEADSLAAAVRTGSLLPG